MVARIAALLAVSALFIAGCDLRPRPFSSVFGNDGCRYKDATYSHGSTACQSGTQYRCDDGQWKGWGTACSESPIAAAKVCEFDGDSYSLGSASCQSGTQYRCDDGAWRNLALACAGGADGGSQTMPSGLTCVYNGATVTTESTICKAGVTFRCEDGDWRNLGTACR